MGPSTESIPVTKSSSKAYNRTKTPGSPVTHDPRGLAQLRHLYVQLLDRRVTGPLAARGLLAPGIKELEMLHDEVDKLTAAWWRQFAALWHSIGWQASLDPKLASISAFQRAYDAWVKTQESK